jgi:hypothetical protein
MDLWISRPSEGFPVQADRSFWPGLHLGGLDTGGRGLDMAVLAGAQQLVCMPGVDEWQTE